MQRESPCRGRKKNKKYRGFLHGPDLIIPADYRQLRRKLERRLPAPDGSVGPHCPNQAEPGGFSIFRSGGAADFGKYIRRPGAGNAA